MSEALSIDLVREMLREHVYDPELGVNVVDLGLIYDIGIQDGDVHILMTLTTPGCPAHDTIAGGVRNVIAGLEAVTSVDVELVWSPPWNPEMMTERAREELGYL